MYKSILDVFGDNNAVFIEPYNEISSSIVPQECEPLTKEYTDFLDSLISFTDYPTPKIKLIHHRINPNNDDLKSIYNL